MRAIAVRDDGAATQGMGDQARDEATHRRSIGSSWRMLVRVAMGPGSSTDAGGPPARNLTWLTDTTNGMAAMEETTPRGSFTAGQLALVRRQISMWENNRDDVGAGDDWCADGELTAPRGVRLLAEDIAEAIRGWHEVLTDLYVELTALFASPDGNWLAIEWSWHARRRRDLAQSITPDAIIVELRDGKIASWREYFDTFGSVEFE